MGSINYHQGEFLQKTSWAVVAHAFNPNTRKAEAGRSLVSSRPIWTTRASSMTGSKPTEKPCLEKPKKKTY